MIDINSSTNRGKDAFADFAKQPKKKAKSKNLNQVVVYTRVSSLEQASNMSLPYQRQVIDEYAHRTGLEIIAYFGGKHESAKTDGRIEFQRMLDFIKKHHGKISQVLVYAIDRFSRTGGEAIKLAQDLRDTYGVFINAVSQPTDVSNPTGIFQQNLSLLFAQYDNTLRKQRIVAGMIYKLERGFWILNTPLGYDSIRVNGNKKIVVNETGKILRNAFYWKAQGMKNEEIITKLKLLGVKMYHQQISKLLKNPFYCGMVTHGLLGGRIVQGMHEPMIPKELFIKCNEITSAASYNSVPHEKENEELPLKVFLKCDKCGNPFTGYLVKKKNLYYYKCRTVGCRCNKSAKLLNEMFKNILNQYTIKTEYIEPIRYALQETYNEQTKEQRTKEQQLRTRLAQIDSQLDSIEEKFFALNQMTFEIYEKFRLRYLNDKAVIEKELDSFKSRISNLEKSLDSTLSLCTNLNVLWEKGTVKVKEQLQKLIFPHGIYYNNENGTVRTEKVNSVFVLIAQLTGSLDQKKWETNDKFSVDSPLVELRGVEPRSGEGIDCAFYMFIGN